MPGGKRRLQGTPGRAVGVAPVVDVGGAVSAGGGVGVRRVGGAATVVGRGRVVGVATVVGLGGAVNAGGGVSVGRVVGAVTVPINSAVVAGACCLVTTALRPCLCAPLFTGDFVSR